MSSFYPIIQNFLGGVLTRKGWGAVTSAAYASGMEYCVNWVVAVQGSIRKRAGSEFVTQYDGTGAVVKTLAEKDDNDIICTFVDNKLYLSDTSGIIRDTPNIVKNGAFTENKKNWVTDQARNVPALPTDETPVGDRLLMAASSDVIVKASPFGRTLRMLASTKEYGTGGVRWARVIQTIPIENGGAVHTLNLSLRTSTRLIDKKYKVQYNVRVGAVKYGHELVNKKIFVTVPKQAQFFTSGNQKISVTFTPPALTTHVYLMFEVVLLIAAPVEDPKHAGLILTTDNSGSLMINDVVMYDSVAGAEVVLTTPYNIEMLNEIQTVSDSGKSSMWVAHKDFEPHILRRNVTSFLWEFVPFEIVSPPASWGSNNYPSAVCIYGSRLYFASTPVEPSKIWSSAVGKYEDFAVPTSAKPDSPLQFDLATPATIRWMIAAKTLLIGTDNSEWLLTAAGGVITPTDFQFQLQSAYGCSAKQPSMAGMGVIYASNTGLKLRYITDGGLATNSWVSQDIIAQAENISGGTIVDIAYILEPDYQIYLLMSNGIIARCTFSTDSGVVAWALLVDAAGGRIKSITSVNTPAGQYLYTTTERGFSPEKTFLERTNPQEVFEVLLDSYGTYDVESQGGVSRLVDVTGDNWEVLGQGINKQGLAIDTHGSKVYVGGNFTVAGGLNDTDYIAQWDNISETWSAMEIGADGIVEAITVHQTSGNVYAGGQFNSMSGVVNTPKIAKWNGSAWSALGLGFDNTVFCIAAQEFGTGLYAGGVFSKSGAVDIKSIAKFDGALWQPLAGNKLDGEVNDIVILDDNRVIAVGDFNVPTIVNGIRSAIRFKDNVLQNMGIVAPSIIYDSFYDAVNNRVYAYGNYSTATLAPIGAGYWDVATEAWVKPYNYVGIAALGYFKSGAFSGNGVQYAGVIGDEVNASLYVLKFWDAANNRWSYPVQVSQTAKPTNGNVLSICADPLNPDGIYFAGDFTAAQGYTQMGRVCYYDKALQTYKRLGGGSALGSGTNGGLNNIVRMVRVAPALPAADPVKFFYRGQAIAVGDFTASSAGTPVTCRGVARYDSAANKWLAVGSGLAGGLNAVNCVAFDDDGRIYAGGSFINIGSVDSSIDRIAMFDPNLSASSWYPVGAGIDDGQVTSITINNGKMYVSGTFTAIGGVPYKGYAVYDLTGQIWDKPDLYLSTNQDAFYSITFDSDGKMYGLGSFNNITYAASDIAIYNPTGDTWTGIKNGVSNGYINTVHEYFDGADKWIVFGGLFESASGVPNTKNIAVYSVANDEIVSIGSIDGEVFSIRENQDPLLGVLVTGNFTKVFMQEDGSYVEAAGIAGIGGQYAVGVFTGENQNGVVDACFNDGGVLFALGSFASSGRYIEGLDRLEGREVTLLSINPTDSNADTLLSDPANYAKRSVFDGYYIREDLDKHLVTEGRIEVPEWCGDSAYVGLSYEAVFKTLPLEGGLPSGTAQGGANRFNKVFVRLNESNLPLIRCSGGSSMNASNAYQPQINSDADLPVWGEPSQAFVSGDFDISCVGFDQHSAIIISAPQSIRTEVVAIFGKATTSKL